MTFVLDGLWRSGKLLLRKGLMQKGSVHAVQALFPLRRRFLPMRGLLRKSSTPGLLLLPSLQEGRLREAVLGMYLVLRPVRLPLLPLNIGPAKGVEVFLVARLVRVSALLSPLLLRELRRGELLVCSRRPLPALLPRWALPAHHCTFCEVVSRESLRRAAPVRDPPVFPDPRIEEHGRIVEPALGGTRLGGTDRGLLTAIGRVAFSLARCLGVIGRSPRTATGIALGVIGRNLLITTVLDRSVCDPLLVGEVAVTACGQAIPLSALVTARSHLYPLTVHGQRIEAGEPDVSNGRVWGR